MCRLCDPMTPQAPCPTQITPVTASADATAAPAAGTTSAQQTAAATLPQGVGTPGRRVLIKGGMVPKLETCVTAVESGCEAAVVLDGRVPHAMLLEFFTARGAGTLVRA